jgi:uncharacterized protein
MRRQLPPGVRPLRLISDDGVELSGYHRPGADRSVALVLGHGFTHSALRRRNRLIARRFARGGAGVLAVDFRGHGRSSGRATVGLEEYLDMDATVAAARALGYERVATVGFSMGGCVALQQAVLGAHRPDVVVSVSSPSHWYIRETMYMRRVHWFLEHPVGYRISSLIGVRLGKPWPYIPETPLELAGRIAPLPLLLVHGTSDRYFGAQHGAALHRAAGWGEFWIENGMDHAESGTTPQLVDRIESWIRTQLPVDSAPADTARPAESQRERSAHHPAGARAAGGRSGHSGPADRRVESR